MMADPDDLAVDKIIGRMESALTDLKAAQKKDEADEDSEEGSESKEESSEGEQPKSLKDAAGKARQVFAAKRAASK